MRLDKFVAKACCLARQESKKIITRKRVSVNGQLVTNPGYKLAESSQVELDGGKLAYRDKVYLLLNKPPGYICSSKDEIHPSALRLLADMQTQGLHFAGRLDQDTSGLVLISNDGQWTHRVTSPKHRCLKIYRVTTADEVSVKQAGDLSRGVKLKTDEKITLAATVEIIKSHEILLGITEGRYHQVKRMLAAVGNRVLSLHREQVGGIELGDLAEGEWRELSAPEIAMF